MAGRGVSTRICHIPMIVQGASKGKPAAAHGPSKRGAATITSDSIYLPGSLPIQHGGTATCGGWRPRPLAGRIDHPLLWTVVHCRLVPSEAGSLREHPAIALAHGRPPRGMESWAHECVSERQGAWGANLGLTTRVLKMCVSAIRCERWYFSQPGVHYFFRSLPCSTRPQSFRVRQSQHGEYAGQFWCACREFWRFHAFGVPRSRHVVALRFIIAPVGKRDLGLTLGCGKDSWLWRR